jgi:putative N6-adenine-specific DNA methylase
MLHCIALCAIGAEKVLGNEIKQLGYSLGDTIGVPGRVRYSAPDVAGLYRSNLCLRTADRVFLEAASYSADNFDALYEGAYEAPWQDFFKKNMRVVIDKVRCNKSMLSSEHSVQSVVHKAVCQKLCDVWGMKTLPESGATAAIRVYVDRDTAALALDTSGEALHKRGYRTQGGEAPMRETMAAVMLQLAGWRRKIPLHDPFCGSGTIICEAMLYAYNAPPGFGRHFAFEDLAFFSSALDKKVRLEEAAKIRTDCLVRLTGSDIDPAALETSRANAERACVTVGRALQLSGSDAMSPRPDFVQSDFLDLSAPYESGMLLSNPPYGERMGSEEEAEALYKSMRALFVNFPQWKQGFITAHERFEQAIGQKAPVKRKLKSGKLDTVFYFF